MTTQETKPSATVSLMTDWHLSITGHRLVTAPDGTVAVCGSRVVTVLSNL